jgi:4-hydroxy-2-oxoheptanedioate aldolase
VEHFLREPWRQGKPALGVWNSVGDTMIAEAIASLGPDYVCVDMQHGTPGVEQLVPLIQAIEVGGSTPIVRVPECNPAIIMRALDSGARGVVVPLVEDGAEAARAVAACRFPPAGRRSFGPFRSSIKAGSNDPGVLEQVACIVMVETKSGIENITEIAATNGVDAVYIGPSDLSLALGHPPGSMAKPEFIAVAENIRKVCEAHGVVAGMHCHDGESARRAVEQGFGMVTVAVELRTLRQALAAQLEAARTASGTGEL